MASINVDLDYRDHPKTRRLIATLGRGADVIPIRLWLYCGKYHAETGTISPPFTAEIESVVGWWGPKGQCVEALIECGFIDRSDDSLIIHDWHDHAGHIHAGRLKAKAMAKAKWEKYKADAASITVSSAASSADSDAKARQGKARQGKARDGPLNVGFYPEELAAARRIVAAYAVVGSPYPPSGNVEATIIEAMLDHPTRTESDFVRAINAYADAVKDLDKKIRKGIGSWFQAGDWQRYIDGSHTLPETSLPDQIAAARAANEAAAKKARGEA